MTDVPVDYDPFAKTTKFDAKGNAIPEPADKTYPVDYNPFEQTGLSQFREAQGLPPVTTPPPSKPTNVVDAVAQGMARQAGNALIGPREAYRHGMTPEQEVEWASGTALQMAGRAPFAPEGAAGIFGGKIGAARLAEEGNLRPKQDFNLAQEMDAQGFERQQIWDATGWFKGYDGKWRFEINDEGAFIPEEGLPREIRGEKDYSTSPPSDKYEEYVAPGFAKDYKIKDAITHPAASQAYPYEELPLKGDHGLFSRGSYNPSTGTFTLARAKTKDALSTMLHELQHYVQHQEGFASGGNTYQFTPKRAARYREVFNKTENEIRDWLELAGIKRANPRMAEDIADTLVNPEKNAYRLNYIRRPESKSDYKPYLDVLEKSPELLERVSKLGIARKNFNIIEERAFNNYLRLAGELESRAVQARQKMSPEERKAEPPWITYERLLNALPEDMREPIVQYNVPDQPE